MRYIEFIFEGYPEAIRDFTAQSGDKNQVQTTINTYKTLVNKNQVQGNERNIDWWRKQGWDKFKSFVDEKSTQPTATQVKRKRASGQSITLKETTDWLIVVPLDHDASCFHGRNTEWCTARPTGHYFDKYFLDDEVNLIYVLNKQTGGKWAIASHVNVEEIELFDQQDQSITETEFKQQTGFNPSDLIKLLPVGDSRIVQARTTRRELLDTLRYKLQVWQSRRMFHRDTEIEELLIKSKHGGSCYDYMALIGQLHGPREFPEIIQLAGVRYRGGVIKFIKDPKPSIQIAAVKQYGYAIQYIKNPSPAVQLAAVEQDGRAIEYINDPGETVQLAAVKQYGYAIQYIKNPSPAVQLAAVEQDGHAIRYINDPGPAVQIAAVKQDGDLIQYIKNPGEAVQLAAVKQNGYTIIYIKNPSPAVQLAAVKQNGRVIQYIKNPSPAVQLAAGMK
jgi:hypothetical protein